jgi:hypothetical protein
MKDILYSYTTNILILNRQATIGGLLITVCFFGIAKSSVSAR